LWIGDSHTDGGGDNEAWSVSETTLSGVERLHLMTTAERRPQCRTEPTSGDAVEEEVRRVIDVEYLQQQQQHIQRVDATAAFTADHFKALNSFEPKS